MFFISSSHNHFLLFSVIFSCKLVKSQREMAYHNFVALPSTRMAPWNIVFQGSRMAYIDYDTKDVTYDNIVSAENDSKSSITNILSRTDLSFQILFVLQPTIPRCLSRTRHCLCFSTTNVQLRTSANVDRQDTIHMDFLMCPIVLGTQMTSKRMVESIATVKPEVWRWVMPARLHFVLEGALNP